MSFRHNHMPGSQEDQHLDHIVGAGPAEHLDKLDAHHQAEHIFQEDEKLRRVPALQQQLQNIADRLNCFEDFASHMASPPE